MILITQNLSIVPIAIFLLTAIVGVICNRSTNLIILVLATLTSLTSSIYLTSHLLPINYAVGGWNAPVGIELIVTPLTIFMHVLIDIIATACLIHSYNHRHNNLFYSLFSFYLAGAHGIVASNDLFNIYVFLEIFSISSYLLAAFDNTKGALMASFRYLIYGSIGTLLILIAIAFIYIETGTLNISLATQALGQDGKANIIAICSSLLMFTGLVIKTGSAPFHSWLKAVYIHSNKTVTALFSGITGKVILYLMLHIYSVFPTTITHHHLNNILIIIGVVSACFGSYKAWHNNQLTRLTLAYSSIAHIGYVVTAIGLHNQLALKAALYIIFSHAITKTILFLHYNNDWITKVNLAALAGLPITSGFVGKWIIMTSLDNKLSMFSLLVGLLSFISIGYCYKILYTLKKRHYSKVENIPVYFLTAINIGNGIYPNFMLQLINSIVKHISL
jgi:formate hydrogenlyase subunit 3/multisubunit Na+/H+ antiporter MnhD subunit